MLSRLGERIEKALGDVEPWTNVVGLARTILAAGLFLTLLFNGPELLFVKVAGLPSPPICVGVARGSLYCITGAQHLQLARFLSMAGLLLVMSGWRPRVTGLLHVWLAWSFQITATVLDGGDQVHQVLSILLLPIALTDRRRWHWDPAPAPAADVTSGARRLLATTAYWLIRIQVAGIYFHAAVGKYAVRDWSDGTAMYYWLLHPQFGIAEWQRPIVTPILTHETVAVLTWGVIVFELLLMAGLVASKKTWRYLLVGGLMLHGSIALMQGLVSFCFSMSGALILYLRPLEQPFDFRWLPRALARLRARREARPARSPEPSSTAAP